MPVIAIFGGSQKETYRKLANRKGYTLLFHDAKSPQRKTIHTFKKMVKKADVVVIMKGACGHETMWTVKAFAQEYGKPVIYHQGFGATGAIEKVCELRRDIHKTGDFMHI